MAGEILYPSVSIPSTLSGRLNSDTIRVGAGVDENTYKKIILLVNSLSKKDIEDFQFLFSHSPYCVYLELSKLALNKDPIVKDFFKTLNHRFGYGMSSQYGNNILGYSAVCGPFVTACLAAIIIVLNDIGAEKMNTALKAVGGAVGVLVIVLAIIGFPLKAVDAKVNYNDRVIKLFNTVMQLRLEGIKYIESIKEEFSGRKADFLATLNSKLSNNKWHRDLVRFANIVFNDRYAAEYYRLVFFDDLSLRQCLFRLSPLNESYGGFFYKEAQTLWDEISSILRKKSSSVSAPAPQAEAPSGTSESNTAPDFRGRLATTPLLTKKGKKIV